MNTHKPGQRARKILIIGALSAVALNGCKTWFWADEADTADPQANFPGDWREQVSRSNLLSLTADDYEGLSSRGSPAQWHPLLLPLRPSLILSDRDFVLGTTNTIGTIDAQIPEAGLCHLMPNSAVINSQPAKGLNESQTKNEISFTLLDARGQPQENASGQLFFIHEQSTRAVRAIGFFDEKGKANCPLTTGRWYISTGFGEARTHKIFSVQSGKTTSVEIRHHIRARLTLRPGKDTGLQYGDLLRIGRITALQPATQREELLPEVPIQIQDDLFRAVLTPSENAGVREYLFTSLILQRREISIQLEPGEYAIGLWRNGEMYRCTSRLLVSSNESALLACDPNMESSRISEQNRIYAEPSGSGASTLKSIAFDGSFFPSRLIVQTPFRAWLAKNGITRLMRAGPAVDDREQQRQFLLQPLLQDFSAKKLQQPEGPFIADFKINQRLNVEDNLGRASFARLLIAQSGMNVDAMLNRVFQSKALNQVIPMSGITERGLLEGVVPLTFRTILKSPEGRTFRTETADAMVTNGAQIEWIEPLPATVGSPLTLGPQQHLRLRLLIPPEDTTENFGMFVNGDRYKQWSVGRDADRSKYRTIEIEEKVTLQGDFMVSFAAWGQNYLPEFMYGIRQLPAFSFTRIYCVDVNENGICDKQ
ncbi:MAG: hypothetical protein FJY29_07960 [Betaproteobacteria bacterium]|nr:hypothetical protein [Betaproteobacteria bacterium]